MLGSSLSNKLRAMTFDNFKVTPQNQKAYEACKKYAECPDERGILLLGSPGVGKTHLAAATANETGGYFWATVPELLDALRPDSALGDLRRRADACYEGPGNWGYCGNLYTPPELRPPTCQVCRAVRNRGGIKEQAMDARLLVLDDLGTAKPSEFVAEQLYTIVNFRSEMELPIIGTTNYELRELEARLSPQGSNYGQRTVSRLLGMCNVYRVTGTDRRLERVV